MLYPTELSRSNVGRMESVIRCEFTIPSLEEAIEAELAIFSKEFAEIQSDGIGLSPREKALLRSYLIWKLHVRTRGSQPE